MILSIKNLSKDFMQGETCVEVLKNINLNVKKGEVVAIIGASGSGKSTLLQIAGLLDKQTSGDISICGEDTKNLSNSEKEKIRLRKIGFIYQSHNLLKDFSARENIAMPGLIAGDDYHDCTYKADEFLELLGMEKRKFHFPGALSGGEQQRVAIARALFNDPALLLADEPTGNLDPSTGEEVFEIFLELARSKDTSTIIVTHNHSLAAKADRVLKLNLGELV